MKRLFLLLLVFVTTPFYVLAQKEDTSTLFDKYTKEGYYKVDGANLVVSKVVEEVPGTKEEIYAKVKAWFARSYGDSKEVIQTDDKDNGLIIGKGMYPELATHSMVWVLKAPHFVRVDIKDGRARIICSASTMLVGNPQPAGEYQIGSFYPFTDERCKFATKKAQEKAAVALIERMNASTTSLSDALKSGGVLSAEGEDW